ncbi:hypothetical protein [Flexibacter flexilis]|nr:hypothetical protein [Flexibacter flexilis]
MKNRLNFTEINKRLVLVFNDGSFSTTTGLCYWAEKDFHVAQKTHCYLHDNKRPAPIEPANRQILEALCDELSADTLAMVKIRLLLCNNDFNTIYLFCPEHDLSPMQQIKMAHLIAAMVNLTAWKVVVMTHSDYLIKELCSCIMFGDLVAAGYQHQRPINYQMYFAINRKELVAYNAISGGGFKELQINEFGFLGLEHIERAIDLLDVNEDHFIGLVFGLL